MLNVLYWTLCAYLLYFIVLISVVRRVECFFAERRDRNLNNHKVTPQVTMVSFELTHISMAPKARVNICIWLFIQLTLACL